MMGARSAGGRRTSTVAVIGAGHVGAAVANALVLLRTCVTVVLFDRTLARAQGEAWDIDDTTPLLHEVDVVATDRFDDLAEADVVVVTVGTSIQKGQTRLEILGRNAGLVRAVMAELDRVAPEAAVVVVSNPVDVLTRIAIEASTRPERLIMGSGTVLDTARLRYQLAKGLGVDPQDMQIHVIGEHGDSELAVWSSASIAGVPLRACPLPAGTALQEMGDVCITGTRRRGYDIFDRKGYTNYGIAAAACQIAGAILRDEKRTFSVSVRAPEAYGIGTDVVLGLPSVVGAGGVEHTHVVPMDAGEQAQLERSAAVLAAAYASLGDWAPPNDGRAGAERDPVGQGPAGG